MLDRRGYSLGEMLWVIVILSIVSVLAVPRLDWTSLRIGSETRNLTLQLAYAQRLAVNLQHNVLVTIDRPNRKLLIHEDANNDGAYSSVERRRIVQLENGVNFERNGAPNLPSPGPTAELTSLLYRRDGTASPAGVIFVNSDRGMRVGSNTDARVVEVIRATGRGVWYRFKGGTWVKA